MYSTLVLQPFIQVSPYTLLKLFHMIHVFHIGAAAFYPSYPYTLLKLFHVIHVFHIGAAAFYPSYPYTLLKLFHVIHVFYIGAAAFYPSYPLYPAQIIPRDPCIPHWCCSLLSKLAPILCSNYST